MQSTTEAAKTRILLICSMSLFLVGLDITAVNIALPNIAGDLHTDVAGLQWTVDAYTVVMASLLMFGGSMADRIGRKRVFLVGLSVFALASLMCSVAPTVELLVLARVLQGVGASMLNPVAMSIITNTFTEPRERARAVGVWGAIFGISMALGPIIGGALVSTAGWRAIFLVNIPLGIAAIALTARFVPEPKAPVARRFDPVGQVLVTVLLATLTFGIIEAPSRGWTSAPIILALSAAGAAFAGLAWYESRRVEPLIDPRFFRSVPFSSSIVISIAAFASFGGFLFLNTLYLQGARGLSPIEAGVATLPLALMTVVMSPVSGRMVGRAGPRVPLAIAGVGFTAGSLMLTGVDQHTSLVWLIASYLVFGVGFGFVNAPITNAAISGMPRAQAGVASAVATTSRQVGSTLGVAIVGAVVASGSSAWWMLTAWGASVLLLGWAATSRRANMSARRAAAELNPEAVLA